MAQETIYPWGIQEFTITAGDYAAVAALDGKAKIYLGVSDPNMPVTYSLSQTIEDEQVLLGTYSSDQLVRIVNGAGPVLYQVDGSPQIVTSSLSAYNTAQVLDMNDATVQLTVDNSTTAGTLLTSNVMRVDPNSSGAGEDLELPPEADVPGVVLWIYNTGGENIVVKDDSGVTTVETIATTEFGFFFCDGTAWHGMNVA